MSSPPGNLGEALGGPWGIAESSLPAVAFVVAYTATGQDTAASAAIAIGLALVFAVARLIRRETPWRALSGVFGVAICAFVAIKSGEARNFFLPGLLLNAAYATAFAVSALIRRPLVGYVVAQLEGDGMTVDPERRRAFLLATWMWAGLFTARLAVQLPLYLADATVTLGVARTAMGIPLFAVGLVLSYLLVRGPEARRTRK
ncbi:MAG: hypothetical protein QOF76_75 [Solirubrobacteraceae bacterium]|nr:hypothetical protein [Solirubrobacteraceae bacterium]